MDNIAEMDDPDLATQFRAQNYIQNNLLIIIEVFKYVCTPIMIPVWTKVIRCYEYEPILIPMDQDPLKYQILHFEAYRRLEHWDYVQMRN